MLKSDKSPYMVYKAEQDLLAAVSDTKFGEVQDAEVIVDPISPKELLMLTEAQIVLVEYIRDGHPRLDRIIVHDGQPVEVEVRSLIRKFKSVQMKRL